MAGLEDYKKKEFVKVLGDKLKAIKLREPVKIMEVCGTHTMAIARYGLRGVLPEGAELISGPGCPVCVTPSTIIDAAQKLASLTGVVITTFGDLMRVPGSSRTLEQMKARGSEVRVLYSVFDILQMAKNEPDKNFVFVSVGFETTTPGIALTVLEAERCGLKNISILAANRLVIPALHALCRSGETKIDGFLCPGHVSVIIGSDAYLPVAEEHHVPCVVAGFEPVDILLAVYELILRISRGEDGVMNAYGRAVTKGGNRRAIDAMYSVFKPVDAEWRGLGVIPLSGLGLREEFLHLDALVHFGIEPEPVPDPPGCRCGDVLKGLISPPECKFYGNRCTPLSPVGPCMVSSEGSCAAYYKYVGKG